MLASPEPAGAPSRRQPQRGSSPLSPSRAGWLGLVALLLTLAFAFQGTRGIWEPDEGFYSNVTLGMYDSGDWLVPRLNSQPFLDKPPLLYWSAATGLAVFGIGEWGVRTGQACWFVGAALLVGALGARWWGDRTGRLAALVYATMLAPFLAANVLTPDTPLAFASILSYLLFWRFEEAGAGAARLGWGAATGVALGIGALAKGPAILVMALPMVVFLFWRRRSWRPVVDPGAWAIAASFLAVALPWPLWLGARLPGALSYLYDNQIAGRLVTDSYARNSDLFGGLRVYLPTLLLGTLPWSLVWLRRPRAPGLRLVAPDARPRELDTLVPTLLGLWVVLPWLVFTLARSRLPLYVLPLFAPLALATANRLARGGRFLARPLSAPRQAAIGIWVLALLVLKALAADLPTDRDARSIASALVAAGVETSERIVTLDAKLNGLALYGFVHLEPATRASSPYPFFVPMPVFGDVIREMAQDGEPRAIVVDQRRSAEVMAELERQGLAHGPATRLARHFSLIRAGG